MVYLELKDDKNLKLNINEEQDYLNDVKISIIELDTEELMDLILESLNKDILGDVVKLKLSNNIPTREKKYKVEFNGWEK